MPRHPGKRKDETAKIMRQRRVALYLLGGIRDQVRIAERLNVSGATISRDVKEIEAQWREQTIATLDSAKAKDVERIERLIAGIWERAINGEMQAIDRMLKLLNHRAKLLGLYAPEAHELSGPNGGPVRLDVRDMSVFTDDELREIASIEKRAQQRERIAA